MMIKSRSKKTDGTCGILGGKLKINNRLVGSTKLKVRDHLEDLRMDERIILK
jgi:hypothetical protein